MEYFVLNNGKKMPVLGLGTLNLLGKEGEEAVDRAIRMGYRHLDTASSYLNEKAVGRGIRNSGIDRNELFITVKVWPSEYTHCDKALQESYARLGIEYADLLLLHHPIGDCDGAWRVFEQYVKDGKAGSLGLSNFSKEQIEHYMNDFEIGPSLVTVESHPYAQQHELRSFLKKHGIVMEAWYPLGHGDQSLTQEKIFLSLAEKYGKTPVQIILRWHIQVGNSVLPGSKSAMHQEENFDVFDFALTEEEMQEIAQLDRKELYKNFTQAMRERYLAWEPDFNDQL